MGGIPWQSKGCRNCKKRRVKCDEQKPECLRCIKYGTKCLGYGRDQRFVVYSAAKNFQGMAQGLRGQSQVLQHDISARGSLSQGITAGPSKREQIFSRYADMFFPTGPDAKSSVDLWYYLISNFSVLPSKSDMLMKSLAALSCAYIGKQNYDQNILRYGLQLYNSAIRQMAAMINRDTYCDDIIYTTVIFQEIETYHCPHGLQGWISHVVGTNAIMNHYRRRPGKSALVDTIYHEYQKQRLVMSAQGVNLNQEEFDYVTQPSEGNPMVELLRLYGQFTPIANAVKMARPPNHKSCRMLLRRCLKHLEKVCAWYSRNVIRGPEECAPGEILTKRIPQTDEIFGTPYRFHSLDSGKIHTMYWTLLSIMHVVISRARNLVRVYDIDPLTPDVGEQFGDPDYVMSSYWGDQIARAIPFHAQDSMKSWGIHSVVFSLCQTTKASAIDSGDRRKFDWCYSVFNAFGKAGFESSARLSEVFSGLWMYHQAQRAGIVTNLDASSPQPGTPESVRRQHDAVGGVSKIPNMLMNEVAQREASP